MLFFLRKRKKEHQHRYVEKERRPHVKCHLCGRTLVEVVYVVCEECGHMYRKYVILDQHKELYLAREHEYHPDTGHQTKDIKVYLCEPCYESFKKRLDDLLSQLRQLSSVDMEVLNPDNTIVCLSSKTMLEICEMLKGVGYVLSRPREDYERTEDGKQVKGVIVDAYRPHKYKIHTTVRLLLPHRYLLDELRGSEVRKSDQVS